MFLDAGGLYVAIPGQVKGYWEAHKKYGRLPWRDLFKPTIRLCKNGLRINHHLYLQLSHSKNTIKNEPTFSEMYINPKTNELYQVLCNY